MRASLAYLLEDLLDYVELRHYGCQDAQLDCRCIPPPSLIYPAENAQYHRIPRDSPYKLPIGTNQLTHYFQNPSCISERLVIASNQIPKHLGQCVATSGHEPLEGWDLEFEEGWDQVRLRNAIFGVVI